MSRLLQVDLAVVEPCEGLVAGLASVGSEAGVDVPMDSPLNARLETLGTEVTEESLLLVSSHDVVVEL